MITSAFLSNDPQVLPMCSARLAASYVSKSGFVQSVCLCLSVTVITITFIINIRITTITIIIFMSFASAISMSETVSLSLSISLSLTLTLNHSLFWRVLTTHVHVFARVSRATPFSSVLFGSRLSLESHLFLRSSMMTTTSPASSLYTEL